MSPTPDDALAGLRAIGGPAVLAIGVFDGVHLGHRSVIARAMDDARKLGGTTAVITFDPHPARVLRPEKAPRLLTSTPHKVRIIGGLGVRHIVAIPFTMEFAAQEPETFIRSLAAACQLREICVGHEWCFGRERAGNLALLQRLGDELGFAEVGVKAVQIDQEVVSSTLIRAAVEAGDLAKAERFLGRPYSILGTVKRGAQLGRTIGFPTANLSAHSEQFPPNGVYAVDALLADGMKRGVANIGLRPTVEKDAVERRLEVHLFNFEGDLYGNDFEVVFRRFLRPEQRFESLEALRAQIAVDAAEARRG